MEYNAGVLEKTLLYQTIYVNVMYGSITPSQQVCQQQLT